MSTSLRAFLMLRNEDGAWDINVYQTLEEVVRSWDHRGPNVVSAVLHVGFERRVARSFDEVALSYPARILLTSGAKGALPNSFKSSVHAVAVVNEEPIFLALEGWGYAEAEPIVGAPAPAPQAFGDWVRNFIDANPDTICDLETAGIRNEADYLLLESTLPCELRSQLGLFRFDILCGSQEDPTDMARAAPPWLQKSRLDGLNLTVRIGNVFSRLGLITVGDLTALNIPDLLELQNFGRKSVRDLVEILAKGLAAGPRPPDALFVPESDSLIEALTASLETCDARERDILSRRMGLERQPETLADIGECYGITRERIRQIESKCIQRLIHREVWDDILADKLKRLLSDREFPLPLIGVEALDPWFAGAGRHRNAMKYLIENMTETNVRLTEIGGVEYLSFLSQEGWSGLLASGRKLLAGGVEPGWTEDQCRTYVSALLPNDAREFQSLLWDNVSQWCQFADDTDERRLISYGRGANQVVEAVLAESDVPLHYTEIAKLTSERGRPMDERRAHQSAAEVGYLFGPGQYGTLRHLSVSPEECELLGGEAAEIVEEGPPERQWHASELLIALEERGVQIPEGFDKYQLDIVLKEQGDLCSLGRMVWSIEDGKAQGARLDIRQAIIATLQNAGAPISTNELRQRLIAVRGIDQAMQLHAVDPMIKLDAQTWGLNDRDLAIKRPEQPAYLDRIAATLREIDRPVHISECEALFGSDLPSRALFGLALRDPKFDITPDRHLKLAEWRSSFHEETSFQSASLSG